MIIKTIEDNNTNFEIVKLKDSGNTGRLTPHCSTHGAMNKVSRYPNGGGLWRCHNKRCRAGCEEIK